MARYDSRSFDPPAPVARVVLRNRESGTDSTPVIMLIDSGADVTLIPWVTVQEIGLSAETTEGYELVGFDGSTSVAQSVDLDLIFLDKTFRGKYLVTDREVGLLGRDVLNLVSLRLDGPNLTWSVAVSAGLTL